MGAEETSMCRANQILVRILVLAGLTTGISSSGEAQCALPGATYWTAQSYTLGQCDTITATQRSWMLAALENVFPESEFEHAYCSHVYEQAENWLEIDAALMIMFAAHSSSDADGEPFGASSYYPGGTMERGLLAKEWIENQDQAEAAVIAMHEGVHHLCDYGDTDACDPCEEEPGEFDDECLTDLATDYSDQVQTLPPPLVSLMYWRRAHASATVRRMTAYSHYLDFQMLTPYAHASEVPHGPDATTQHQDSDSLAAELIVAAIGHAKRLYGFSDSSKTAEGISNHDELSATLNLRIRRQDQVLEQAARRLEMDVVPPEARYCITRKEGGVTELLCGVHGVDLVYTPSIRQRVGIRAFVVVSLTGNTREGGPGGMRGTMWLDLVEESGNWIVLDWGKASH